MFISAFDMRSAMAARSYNLFLSPRKLIPQYFPPLEEGAVGDGVWLQTWD